MRILLIHPPKTHQVWAGVPSVFNDKYAYLFPPLAVMGLSAYLKQHTAHQVEVLDCVVEQLAFEQIGPRVLGVGDGPGGHSSCRRAQRHQKGLDGRHASSFTCDL